MKEAAETRTPLEWARHWVAYYEKRLQIRPGDRVYRKQLRHWRCCLRRREQVAVEEQDRA